jgi:hypothetical protein
MVDMSKIYKFRNDLDQFPPNGTYHFMETDSEFNLNYNLKEEPDNSSLQYYLNNPITYKLNNCGFRTPDDFNPYDWGNVYLGCSHTFGIGHHLENTWSYKLNKALGDGKFWNLGIGGTGVMTQFRILLGYYKELRIKNIFHYAPKYPRYEFIENGVPQYYIISNYNENWLPKFGTLMSDSLLTDEQIEFNWKAYTYACRAIANEIKANYYLIEGDVGLQSHADDSLQARDLFHHTTRYQEKIFKQFLNGII